MKAPETVFPIAPSKAGKGSVFEVANTVFVAPMFPQLPDGAFAAVCSKPGDHSLGGWHSGAKK